jgi:hypothetical protein
VSTTIAPALLTGSVAMSDMSTTSKAPPVQIARDVACDPVSYKPQEYIYVNICVLFAAKAKGCKL